MAERKYDLLLVQTGHERIKPQACKKIEEGLSSKKSQSKILQYEWNPSEFWKILNKILKTHGFLYQERLKLKYLKSDMKNPSHRVNAKDWKFLKDGLDDFRDGLPPSIGDDIFIRQTTSIAPNVTGKDSTSKTVKESATHNRFTKEEVCYLKSLPLTQQRRDNIDEIEYGLMQHPLALFPHLEESLPPDIFEEIVDILDPEMNILDEESATSSRSNSPQEGNDFEAAENTERPPVSEEVDSLDLKETVDSEANEEEDKENAEDESPNQFKWLPRKEESEKRDQKKKEMRSVSAAANKHIKKVTKEFCNWIVSLGGESNNIEESTVTSLFASGYETKPALSVPIHVVELTSIPPELRGNVAMPPSTSRDYAKSSTSESKKEELEDNNLGRFRYGAWYLPHKHWKKMDKDEPLINPKEQLDTKQIEAKERNDALDKELAPMHGAKSFMEFVEKKGVRKPEFLIDIATIQRKIEQEEAKRLEEAENSKKSSKKPVTTDEQNQQ